MKLKRYINFVNSQCDIEFLNESISIHKGDFKVTSDMVSNGMLIKDMIPREVVGGFDCRYNELTSLIGSPESVGGSFNCNGNLLTSLKGSPESVGGNFWSSDNLLTSLEGCPVEVSRSFGCSRNLLTSLIGGPKSIGGSFYCSDNQLSSLEHCPESIGKYFYCSNNKIDLEIEEDYIKSSFRKDDKYDGTVDCKQYYTGLLKYMISNNIDLTEVTSWPKDFITDELIQSTKGINKFKL